MLSSLATGDSPIVSINKRIVVDKRVVEINNRCSGFIVEPNLIVTASHCINGMGTQVVEFYSHKKAFFKILFDTKEIRNGNDYAILQGDTGNIKGFKLTKRIPKYKDLIYNIGYSMGLKVQFYAPGFYNRFDCSAKHGCEHYVIAQILPGDSGGPLVYKATDKVFGLVNASYWPENIPYGMGGPIIKVINKLKELNKSR